MAAYSKPAFDGNIAFAEIIDFNLENNADRVYAYLPSDSDAPLRITWMEFARAVHRAAHLINPTDSETRRIGERKVIAIFAVTDTLVYMAIILAIIRSGNIPFPISHRNTPAAVINIMLKTSCRYLITGDIPSLTDSTAELLRALDEQTIDITTINMPTYHQLFPELGHEISTYKFSPYPPVRKTSQEDLVMIIHSSGSTGFPKPIPFKQRYLMGMLQTDIVQHVPADSTLGGGHLPPFHLAGVYSNLIQPIGSGCAISLFKPTYPSTVFVTPETTIELFEKTNIDCMMTVPSFLTAWARDVKAVSFLQTLKFIYWAGGPLPTETGNYLASQGVPLCICYAGTEFNFPTIPKAINRNSGRDPEDWLYLEFMPEANVSWAPQEDDEDIFEFQLLDSARLSPAIYNTDTPHGPAYTTSDLLKQHPTKPGLWRIVGRADDQVILSLGEKINPGPIEDRILKSVAVSGVVLFGRAREQAGILVEPAAEETFDPADTIALSAFRNKIWPEVEAANNASASFARIFKEMILVASPNKPLARAPKGTIMRKMSLKMYEAEIEQIYNAVDDSKGNDIQPPRSWDREGLQDWLLANIYDLLGRSNLDPEADLFEQGADSLIATYIRNRLLSAMRRAEEINIQNAAKQVDHNLVFSYPTIASLASYVTHLSAGTSTDRSNVDSWEAHIDAMQHMIQKYTADIPYALHEEDTSSSVIKHVKEVVLITGTTGALGSQLLAQTLDSDIIERVYAVNRPSRKPAAERQRESFEDKALDTFLLTKCLATGKLVYIEADTSKSQIGLGDELYGELISSVTLIIHNAWRLDFNISLASFESQVRGTRNLVDLALSSPKRAAVRFVFTSSIATLASWDRKEKVPEEPLSEVKWSVGNGYGESKYVAEKILEESRTRTGLQTCVFRVGQLSGGRTNNGAWATTDWVPIIIASSVRMGYLPDARGLISWIPLDTAASGILEVSLERGKEMQQTYHVWHPKSSRWSDIFRLITNVLTRLGVTKERELKMVPFHEWHKQLQSIASSSSSSSSSSLVELHYKIPALKLVDFFNIWAAGDKSMYLNGEENEDHEVFGQAEIRTDKVVGASPAMRHSEPLGEEDVLRWISYWKGKGIFQV